MKPHHHNPPKTVLLADRSPFGRMVLRTIVEMAGYHVVAETGDGTAALELHRAHTPAITLLDHDLTTASGEDVAGAIVARDPGARVIQCGWENMGTVPDGVMYKPYDPDQVCRVLLQVAARQDRVEPL